LETLRAKGAQVAYHDPHVPAVAIESGRLESVPAVRAGDYDVVLVLTAHDGYDWARIAAEATLLIDTRNATAGVDADNIIRL
jgi:UDP-N-acetyl-D-glucosamine dehydrogenase